MKRDLCVLVIALFLAGCLFLIFGHRRYAMFVRVENVLSDNLAVVRGVNETPTSQSFLAEFKDRKAWGKYYLMDMEGGTITIEYRWRDNRAIVETWDPGVSWWQVVGMHYEAPKEVG